MTKEELETLYKNCDSEDDFDYDKYEETINDRNGACFTYNKEERNDTYDQAMIDYMEEQGFVIYDDPYSQNMCCNVGWVVFPPIK
jgi:hypothetical protein